MTPAEDDSENQNGDLTSEDKCKSELDSFLFEFEERAKKKTETLARNQTASKRRPDASALSKLDSSLKKNSAFVKKLRNFTGAQLEPLLKDMAGLNLTKYLSEVATALTDVKLKITDVPYAVQLCCLLHCSYAEFSGIFLECWTRILHPKKNDPVENISKLRVDLRFYGELVATGVLPFKDSLPLLGTILTTIVNRDKENHNNVSVIISFCKHCGEDFAGLVAKRVRKLCEQFGREVPRSSLLPPEKQNNVKGLFNEYYTSLCQHLLKDHAKVQAFERQNEQLLRLKGEIREDRIKQLEVMRNDLQSLLTSAETLAELLDQPLPPLPNIGRPAEGGTPETEEGSTPDGGIWEDEESRCFYQVFPNLRDYLPSVKTSTEQPSPIEPPMSEDKLDEEIKEEDLEISVAKKVDEPQKEDETLGNDEPDDPASTNTKVVLDSFLNNLPSCVNREMIDNAAVEFVVFLNTKTSRRKLVKALFSVSRTRLDLLPFYGRLVAILNPVIPEIGTALTGLLKQDFKYHLRKKDQINLESKIKVSRYIGELVKFGLFPNIEALFCLKLLLHDFTHHHIEMACNILETCGRYLYRNPESHMRTKVYLEDMMRLKSATALDIRYTNMIENAYYFVNPPETACAVKKTRPPLHEFVRKLVLRDLMYPENERKVLKQMRCLDWEDEATAEFAVQTLSKAWKIKFHRVPALASLVAGLVEHQESVGTKVVDHVLEDIRLGMEVNLPKMHQRRVSMIKYFGELYNYRLVESTDVFKVLYSLIMFGVSLNRSAPSPLDPPDSLIRIRLACTLLDTCGKFLSHSDVKTKLPYFLTHFQLYYWSKKSSPYWNGESKFPVYAQFQVDDCIEKNCPDVKVVTGYQEALNAVRTLHEKLINEYNIKKEAGGDGYGVIFPPEDDDVLYEEDEDEEEDELEIEKETENEEDFLQELEKMVSDNVQERLKEAIRPSLDIVVPMMGKNQKPDEAESSNSFVMLVRKGNKTLCKGLNVPNDSDLVKGLKRREEVERMEKEKVKKLTLDIQRMQLEDSQDSNSTDSTVPSTNTNHQRRVRYTAPKNLPFYL
uniref:Nonsense-mediated mRNA decay protein 2 n=1 Tax=Lygus hesperus TaxID=30085 RepID=A0A0A9YP83_LYGHE